MDAILGGDILFAEGAASDGIDRFGGGTRRTALTNRWGRRGSLPMGRGHLQRKSEIFFQKIELSVGQVELVV